MDLLFRNYTYFISVYFSVSIETGVSVFCICFVLLLICMRGRARVSSTVLCACYFTILLIVTLLNRNRIGASGTILNPFYEIYQILIKRNIHFLRGMISNVILFVPFGIILDSYFGIKSKLGILAILFIVSLLIEVVQLKCQIGYFETEDIICNVIGGMIGVVIVHTMKKINKICFRRL